jgi:hypothetical protein
LRGFLARGSRVPHLLTGGSLSGAVLAITYYASANATPFSSQPNLSLSLAVLALITGIVFTVATRLERSWVPIVLAPLGILLTLVSRAYQVSSAPGNEAICAVTHVNNGFPLQYYFTMSFEGPRCLRLLLPLLVPPRTALSSFLLDVAFYIAAGLAIIQLYRGITGTTITA